MIISVLIATRDRARLLEGTLHALCEQRSPGCRWSLAVDKIYTLIAHSSTAEFSQYVAQLVMSSR